MHASYYANILCQVSEFVRRKGMLLLLLLVTFLSTGITLLDNQTMASDTAITLPADNQGTQQKDSGNNNISSHDTSQTERPDNLNTNGVSGTGKGAFTCSNGKHLDDASISFTAFKNNNNIQLYGSWETCFLEGWKEYVADI
jgi:hypothetical protein